jgi:hypothetical protein
VPDNADFFVGWGTLSLINAGLAQAKGRSGLLWWADSILKPAGGGGMFTPSSLLAVFDSRVSFEVDR